MPLSELGRVLGNVPRLIDTWVKHEPMFEDQIFRTEFFVLFLFPVLRLRVLHLENSWPILY